MTGWEKTALFLVSLWWFVTLYGAYRLGHFWHTAAELAAILIVYVAFFVPWNDVVFVVLVWIERHRGWLVRWYLSHRRHL